MKVEDLFTEQIFDVDLINKIANYVDKNTERLVEKKITDIYDHELEIKYIKSMGRGR